MHPPTASNTVPIDSADQETVNEYIGIRSLVRNNDGDSITICDSWRKRRASDLAINRDLKPLSFVLLVSCRNGNVSTSAVSCGKVPHTIAAGAPSKTSPVGVFPGACPAAFPTAFPTAFPAP